MRVTAFLRLAFASLAVAVSLVVYLSWQPAAGLERASDRVEVPAMPEGDRSVESHTEKINFVKFRGNRKLYEIAADELLDFSDGWNTWAGVRMRIFGKDGPDKDVVVVGDTMRTSGDGDDFDEIRIIGNVRAELPNNGYFETRRLNYDVVSGVVSNCNRSTLFYAGMESRGDCLHFQTAGDVTSGQNVVAEELRMWGDLTLRRGAGEGAMPAGLRGSAEEMRVRPGGDQVRLQGTAELEMNQASVRADEIVLDVGSGVSELRRIEATGGARVRFFPRADNPAAAAQAALESDGEQVEPLDDEVTRLPGMDSEVASVDVAGTDSTDIAGVADIGPAAGDTSPTGGGDDGDVRLLRGATIRIEFATGELAALVAISGRLGSRLTLPGFGRLEAREIELRPDGDRQSVEARRGVAWRARGDAESLRELTASELMLTAGEAGLQSVEAAGNVVADLAMSSSEASLIFTGEQLIASWVEGALDEAEWPDGVEFEADGRAMSAGAASYTADSGAWRLHGDPAPVLSASGVDLYADEMTWRPDEGIEATGSIRADVADEYLDAASVLFGDTPAVEMTAESAELDVEGVLILRDNVQVIWESQSLETAELRLESNPGRLRAQGAVELVAVAATGEDGEPEYATVSAANLLVEQDGMQLRLGGAASMRQRSRIIEADKLRVEVSEEGGWSEVVAEDAVQFRDTQAEASGNELTYNMESGELLLRGTPAVPARFAYRGIEYKSRDALRVVYETDEVVIESTEDGRTQTIPVPREEVQSP